MQSEERGKTSGRIRISREAERRFFFYATVAMFILYVSVKLFGG